MFRLDHEQLITAMKSLGYSPYDMGVCRGVTLMGMQAFLVNEIDVFNSRLKFIAACPNLSSTIEDTKEKLAGDSATLDSRPLLLTGYEEEVIGVPAFFEGVQLYQAAQDIAAYVGSSVSQYDAEAISKVTQSKKLEQCGGLAKLQSWCGIYNNKELKDYFYFLDACAAKMHEPFSMLLSSGAHVISINYEPLISMWLVINVNQLPATILPVDKLASWVKVALFEFGYMTMFASSIYVTGNHSASVGKKIREVITQSPNFAALYKIGDYKKNYFNSCHVTLAFVAAQYGHVAEIEVLYQAGADLNKANKDGVTPACVAAQNGHAAVIELLGQAGADLDQANKDGVTPAFIAAQCGQVAAIAALGQAGADLNKAMHNGATPAIAAACCNHVSVLAALEAGGVDLTIRTPVGTPLEVARARGNKACIEFLEAYTRRMSNRSGLTLFAAAQHHDERSIPRISNGM